MSSKLVVEPEPPAANARAWWRLPLVGLTAALVFGLAGAAIALLLQDDPPGDSSADAGFARDMTRHHDQAVQMAAIVYRRTEDPVLQTLAYDIMTTQQAQIGIMAGWLQVWDLSLTGEDPAMAWMGHPEEGQMPGMASDVEVAALETLPPAEMDWQFLRLMIEHHEGGVDMAVAGAALCDEEIVCALARGIAASQQIEITTIQQLLDERSIA